MNRTGVGGLTASTDNFPAMIGWVISHYEILEELGGGMRVGYGAEDLNLQCPVALKFRPNAISS